MRMRDTLAQLAANRSSMRLPGGDLGRLHDFPAARRNPGALDARMYLPASLARGAPLVVVLHGCTQSADDYDSGTGWSRLADRAGFALLFPQQQRSNNANLCFNWFQSVDIARHGGEAESIARMAEAMVERHDLDPERIFVTGLSAGGAMAAVMLAAYPDVFAGGAIIGGLPYGCAQGVGQALELMAGRERNGIAAAARVTIGETGRRPSVAIWHGTADRTVVVGNMDALSAQWRGVHGVGDTPSEVDHGPNWERCRWTEGTRIAVETWRVSGMGHGVPIDPAGPDGLGSTGPYMLPVGIDSTAEIARFWGLIPPAVRTTRPAAPAGVPDRRPTAPARSAPRAIVARAQPASGIQAVIEDALRSAGLMK